MKIINILFISTLLSAYLSSFSQEGYSIGVAYDFDQMSENDQNLITSASQSYIELLVNKDTKGFWEACHSKFKESTPFVSFSQMGEIIVEMIPRKDSVIFYDAKKISYMEAPVTSQFATGGSLDKSHPKYLQYYTIAEIKEQAISLYETKDDGYSKMITMKFGLEDSKYKLTNFEINTSKIENKDARYYSNLATEWMTKETKIPSVLALNMAYRFSYLGRGTQTAKSIEITEDLQKQQMDSELKKEVTTWIVDRKEYTIIKLDFLETKSDISPNILYLSKDELGDKTTNKEAHKLYDYMKQKYPDLTKEFRTIMFTAYAEYPALPTKNYKYFRAVLSIDD